MKKQVTHQYLAINHLSYVNDILIERKRKKNNALTLMLFQQPNIVMIAKYFSLFCPSRYSLPNKLWSKVSEQ